MSDEDTIEMRAAIERVDRVTVRLGQIAVHLGAPAAAAISVLACSMVLGRAATAAEIRRIAGLIDYLQRTTADQPTAEGRVSYFAYIARTEAGMTWNQTAALASQLAGQPITPSAIQKRIQRWAADCGLPAPSKYQRRPG